ncbi:hypothetical protein [Sorangium sp. So ce1151]|uniref:hypothetical protein n=1 Tax=Sorangium sp. So ce1151 TaxID=3133332 RepID=UPI003F5F0AD4
MVFIGPSGDILRAHSHRPVLPGHQAGDDVGAGKAAIVGMHIAGFVVAPFDQTCFHSVGNIESQPGVTVAY